MCVCACECECACVCMCVCACKSAHSCTRLCMHMCDILSLRHKIDLSYSCNICHMPWKQMDNIPSLHSFSSKTSVKITTSAAQDESCLLIIRYRSQNYSFTETMFKHLRPLCFRYIMIGGDTYYYTTKPFDSAV